MASKMFRGKYFQLPSVGGYASNIPRRERLMAIVFRRQTIIILIVVTFFLIAPSVYLHNGNTAHGRRPGPQESRIPKRPSKQESRLPSIAQDYVDDRVDNLHLLLPLGDNSDVSLCKTLLSASVLGYPIPSVVSYNQTFKDSKLLGGGSHVAKIEGVLKWLETQADKKKDDIVVVMDAYGGFNYQTTEKQKEKFATGDIWLQLRPEVLLSRYFAVNEMANKRLYERMGFAVEAEGLKQSIVFGAGKQCAPNDPHSVACYAVPESPLSVAMYGKNTDKLVEDKMSNYTTHRPRFLNSGFIMGPISDMTLLFRRAHDKAQAFKAALLETGGATSNISRYHGSDQYIFQEIFGEQEFQREVMKKRHDVPASSWSFFRGSNSFNPLDPPFPHDPVEHKSGKPDEFSVGVDYFSDISYSSGLDSRSDARPITYSHPIAEQGARRASYTCTPQLTGYLPQDILDTTIPSSAVSDASQFSPAHGWDEVGLLTDLCTDSIPAVVQQMGRQKDREAAWTDLWLQPHARRLMEEVLENGAGVTGALGGAYAGVSYLPWEKLCPAAVEPELYREFDDAL